MSKKKNTLKDLDAFLKQQAATLVAPDPLTTKTEAPAPKPEPVQQPPIKAEAITPPVETPPAAPAATPTPEAAVETPAVTPVAVTIPTVQPEQEITAEKILGDLSRLADREGEAFRKTLYDLIIRSLESRAQSLPEDKMLINTALYLKSGDQWKDVIREYWKQHR